MTGTPLFQEVLLQDMNSNIIYVGILASNRTGFDNSYYDFQMIVAESAIKSTPTTYYFFTEVGG